MNTMVRLPHRRTLATAASAVRLSLDEVRSLAVQTLAVAGLQEKSRLALADTITAAERDGCKSHGLFRLPHIVDGIRLGKVDPNSVPEVIDKAPGAVLVQARRGMSTLAFQAGLPSLVKKAKENGVAVMSIVDVFHYSALWPEMEALAAEGLVGMAFLTSKSFVAHHGGSRKVYGTNPMAFGFPRADGHPPLIWDQASAMMARGEITLHGQEGKLLPHGCGVGPDGQPSNEPAAVLAGSQLPFGGHKGSAIALMVELLASGLTGAPLSSQQREEDVDSRDASPTRAGELVLAINPGVTSAVGGAGAVAAHCESLFAEILGDEGTRLPSSRRYQMRETTPVTGVEVPGWLHDAIIERRGPP